MTDIGNNFLTQGINKWEASKRIKDLSGMMEAVDLFNLAIENSCHNMVHSILADVYHAVGLAHWQAEGPDAKKKYDEFIVLCLEQCKLSLEVEENDLMTLIVLTFVKAEEIMLQPRIFEYMALPSDNVWRMHPEFDTDIVVLQRSLLSHLSTLIESLVHHLNTKVVHAIHMEQVMENLMLLSDGMLKSTLIPNMVPFIIFNDVWEFSIRVDLDRDVSWDGIRAEMEQGARTRMAGYSAKASIARMIFVD
ncbi:MAG: hypothetical protein OEX81_03440 [Candidatus Pacebacteria bacterium]|nr:hypothetical protein [Candidatus Paceibacterota bacterium]